MLRCYRVLIKLKIHALTLKTTLVLQARKQSAQICSFNDHLLIGLSFQYYFTSLEVIDYDRRLIF